MFDELSKSLKSVLYERVSSPLLGSIAFFWISFNWKPVLYFLLSEDSVENRILHISKNYASFDVNVLFPVVLGGVLSVIYPIISFVPFWISEKIKHAQRNIKQKFSLSQLLTLEQSISLRKELVTKEKRIKSIISDGQTLRSELERQIKDLTDENTDLYHRLSELDIIDPDADPREVVLSAIEKKVLSSHTGMKEGYVQVAPDLSGYLEETIENVELALHSLHRRGFLYEDHEMEDGPGYSLTKLGRKYLGYQKSQIAKNFPGNSSQQGDSKSGALV